MFQTFTDGARPLRQADLALAEGIPLNRLRTAVVMRTRVWGA